MICIWTSQVSQPVIPGSPGNRLERWLWCHELGFFRVLWVCSLQLPRWCLDSSSYGVSSFWNLKYFASSYILHATWGLSCLLPLSQDGRGMHAYMHVLLAHAWLCMWSSKVGVRKHSHCSFTDSFWDRVFQAAPELVAMTCAIQQLAVGILSLGWNYRLTATPTGIYMAFLEI